MLLRGVKPITMKALIFLFLAFLLPSCSVFQPIESPVTTRTERLVERYSPDTTVAQYFWMHDGVSFRSVHDEYTPLGTPDLVILGGYTQSVINVDTIWTQPKPVVIDYQVASPESSITTIQVNITRCTITGYSYDSDGRHIEFILSYSLSPWHRDNEKVYDTVLGPVRIVEHPVIFLPYHGRISIGTWQWMIK